MPPELPLQQPAPDFKAALLFLDLEPMLDLGLGNAAASILTSDLTLDYISINADYRT